MAGFLNQVVYALNVDFSGQANPSATMLTDGQLLIASTALNVGGTHINVGKAVTANTTLQFAYSSPNLVVDFGLSNLLLGYKSPFITSAAGNVSLGSATLQNLSSGIDNTCIGLAAGSGISTGNYNVCIGTSAGSAYTTNESSNIIIGALVPGTITESNVIRIGTTGSGSGQQTQCYLAGVLNTNSGRVVKTTSPGAYPYTTLVTDYIILVDTSVARTINLIAAPVTGTTFRIKDNTGSAALNNITVLPAAGNIDGLVSYVINNNYGSVDFVYNGTQWNLF